MSPPKLSVYPSCDSGTPGDGAEQVAYVDLCVTWNSREMLMTSTLSSPLRHQRSKLVPT